MLAKHSHMANMCGQRNKKTQLGLVFLLWLWCRNWLGLKWLKREPYFGSNSENVTAEVVTVKQHFLDFTRQTYFGCLLSGSVC